ncbi:MAG: CehA/McbA family metallohydrolase, partial [Bryobacteraceae bacterium]
LLAVALVRLPPARGQGAVSMSLPGHEDLTFWVNHRGLEQVDVEGEVGFGDMARVLMRRRSNAARMRGLRDRFVFSVRDMEKLDTPDVARAEVRDGKPAWLTPPEPRVAAEGRIVNLPVVVSNRDAQPASLALALGASVVRGSIPARASAGFLLRATAGRLELRIGSEVAATEVRLDPRPLVRLRVVLAEPARVYLTASDGLSYAPRGAIHRFAALPAEGYFHAQGAFEIDLPAGETRIEAVRGIEYEPVSRTIELRQPAEVRLAPRRWIDLPGRGWHSADAHIHANYTAEHHQAITPDDVRLQTLAEDLHYANLMVANSSAAFLHDERLFEGRPHALSRPSHLMYWNEEMRNAGVYGHMCFFELKKLVHPVYTGFRDTPQWEDYPANYTQAAAARAQGGAVTYAHPGYAATFDGASARELPVDLALGAVDAMDVLSNNPEEVATELWYRLLNCGFRLGVSAGTDSFTNVADHYTPGGGRVYAKVAGAFGSAAWTRAFKAGRTFATNGPMISFTVDGQEPGAEVALAKPGRVRVRARVDSHVPVEKVEVIVNGRAAISGSAPTVDRDVTLDASSWIAVRATGPWHRMALNDTSVFAHTSPVYVRVAGRPIVSAEDAKFWTDWIERLIARTRERGRFATGERREEVVALFSRALGKYR